MIAVCFYALKRINRYEYEQKIEHRIIYFLKNYEFDVNKLAVELSKQYNITEKKALKKIQEVKDNFKIRRSRRVLKKLDQIPKQSTPGIDVNIQGKTIENFEAESFGKKHLCFSHDS